MKTTEMSNTELIEALKVTPTFSNLCAEILNQIEINKGLIWVGVSLTNPKGYYKSI